MCELEEHKFSINNPQFFNIQEELGQASTVGELKRLLKDIPDDVSFCFLNQPMQTLYSSFDPNLGTHSVYFQ